MESIVRDLRFGARLLFKDRGFTATATLTLALCIGANTAIFSVVDAVVLRPLPFPDSEETLLLYNSYPGAGAERAKTSVRQYLDRRREVDAFAEQALYTQRDHSIGIEGTPYRVRGMAVTPSFFPLLRVTAELGRTFSDAESERGNHQKVVLSHGLWRRLYGGDTGVLGRSLDIDGQPHTVVGVMSSTFTFLDPEIGLWTPLAFTEQEKSEEARHDNDWNMLGRLKPGTTREQAQAQIDALNAADLERSPELREMLTSAGFHTRVVPLHEDLIRDIAPWLYLLWVAVFFVLLIGCVNIANLFLVRSSGRRKELATRTALGAGGVQVSRQLLIESVLLTFLGALVGCLFGGLGLTLVRTLGLDQIPRGAEIRMDGFAVLETFGLALVVGVVLASIPILSFRRGDLRSILYEQGRGGTSSRTVRTVRRGLAVAQVTIALILLMGAGLLFVSFRQILAVDPGFDSQGVLTATVELPTARYPGDEQVSLYATRAVDGIRSLPGVVEAGAGNSVPFGGRYNKSSIVAENQARKPGESMITPIRVVATPGYFESLKIPLLEGRLFDQRDTAQSGRVALVDEALAQYFWPHEHAVGRRIFQPKSSEETFAPSSEDEWITVVGVVGEVRFQDLTEDRDRAGTYYFPLSQFPTPNKSRRILSFSIRTAGDPMVLSNSLRREMAQIDSELPLYNVQSMEERIAESLSVRRSPMLVLTLFGILALCLSAVGLYGVLAFLVTQRTREIGIRMALGGTARRIFQLVLNEALGLVGAGIVLGVLASQVFVSTLKSQLYGVSPLEPSVLALVIVVLVLTSLAACLIPAWRAARVDPVRILTYE